MIEERLPLTIEPERFAKANRVCEGEINFDQMPSLCECLHEKSGKALVNMQFSLNEEGRVIVDMNIKATLVLECQRCLNGMPFKIDVQTRLTPIKQESDAADLPSGLEAFLLGDEFVSPITLVEENLLLEVPIVPMHENEDCSALVAKMAEPLPEKRENPFEALAGLKEILD